MNHTTKTMLILSSMLLGLTTNVIAAPDKKSRSSKSSSNPKKNQQQDLIDAIYNEDVPRVRSLLKDFPVNDIMRRQGKTPLMYAVAFDKICIECASDFETQKKHLKLPNKAVVEAILQSGADIKAKNRSGQTALHFAAAGSSEIVQLLLDRGGKVILETRDKFQNTPLHFAEQNLDTLKTLLEAGANIDAQDSKGNTLLNNSIQELSFKNFNITTPLQHEAFSRLIKNCVELLLKHRANPNLANKEGMTPLMYAAYYGNPEIVQVLLNAGASLNKQNLKGKTALQIAQEGHQQESAFEEPAKDTEPTENGSGFEKVIALLKR